MVYLGMAYEKFRMGGRSFSYWLYHIIFFSNSFRMAIKTRCTKKRKEIRRGCFTANSYSYNYFFVCYDQRDYQVKKRTKKDIKIDTSYASRY